MYQSRSPGPFNYGPKYTRKAQTWLLDTRLYISFTVSFNVALANAYPIFQCKKYYNHIFSKCISYFTHVTLRFLSVHLCVLQFINNMSTIYFYNRHRRIIKDNNGNESFVTVVSSTQGTNIQPKCQQLSSFPKF